MYMAILVHQACRPEISGLEQTLTTAPRFARGQYRSLNFLCTVLSAGGRLEVRCQANGNTFC